MSLLDKAQNLRPIIPPRQRQEQPFTNNGKISLSEYHVLCRVCGSHVFRSLKIKFFLSEDSFNEWSVERRLESADIEHVIPGSLSGFFVIYRDEVVTPNTVKSEANTNNQSDLFTK